MLQDGRRRVVVRRPAAAHISGATQRRDSTTVARMRSGGSLLSLIGLAFYAATGLAFHLIVYGEVDWSEAFVYVVMAFWPLLLAWEFLKIAAIVAVVVLAGLAVYALVRGLSGRLGRRRI